MIHVVTQQGKVILLQAILDFVQTLGTTSIEVYEWNEANVCLKRLPNSPNFAEFTQKKASLIFNGWRLAHAVVKADYLDRRNLYMPGIGFLLQAGNILDFGAPSIALQKDASEALNDFSLTSLSGRVGQGLAILYGQSLGLKFAAHLRSHVASLPAGSTGAMHVNDAMADFLFANDHLTALIEAKGSFTLQANNPSSIKSVLKGALEKQIYPWMKSLTPVPDNGYVIYSCLREKSWGPSAIFVVDPPGSAGDGWQIRLTPDQVRRENYGSWLRAMGLNDAARRLIDPYSEQKGAREERFFLQEFNGRIYAYRNSYNLPLGSMGYSVPMLGIDFGVLKGISSVLQSANARQSELRVELPEQTPEIQDGVSIFPDGSIFGYANRKPVRYEVVTL